MCNVGAYTGVRYGRKWGGGGGEGSRRHAVNHDCNNVSNVYEAVAARRATALLSQMFLKLNSSSSWKAVPLIVLQGDI